MIVQVAPPRQFSPGPPPKGIQVHFYQFHIGDYSSHTQHLDPLEDIAYRRMLDWLYLNEMPLPDDVQDIARLIRMRSHNDCIADVLREFFDRTEHGYTHGRVDKELKRIQDKSEKAKKSAEARWKKQARDNEGSSDANALRTECEGNATNTQYPIPNKENDRSDDQSLTPDLIEKGFEHFWKIWKDEKKRLDKIDTSPKRQTFEKKWRPYFKSTKTTDEFRDKVNKICNFAIEAHRVEGFNRFENMQTGKFFTEKQWEDE